MVNRRNMVLGLGVTPLAYGMPPTEPPQEPELKLESYVVFQTYPFDAIKLPREYCYGVCKVQSFFEENKPWMEKKYGKIYYKPYPEKKDAALGRFVYNKNRRTIVWEYV